MIIVVFEAELAQRRQRHRQDDRRAVRVGDDAALPARARRLALEQLQMVGVDFGNQQRNGRLHAVVPRVADDDVPGLRRTRASISPATDESRPENTSFGARPGRGRFDDRVRAHRRAGGRQAATRPRRDTPCPRSARWRRATSTLNHGWSASSAMNCWPTMPVAPRIPTGIDGIERLRFSKKKADAVKPCRQGSGSNWI